MKLFHSEPCPQRARDLYSHMKTCLVGDFRYLIQISDEAFTNSLLQKLEFALREFERYEKIAPMLFFIKDLWIMAARGQDLPQALEVARRILTLAVALPDEITLHNVLELSKPDLKALEYVINEETPVYQNVTPLTEDQMHFCEQKTKEALFIIQTLDPELFEEISALTTQIYFGSSNTLGAGASSQLFGAIYINGVFPQEVGVELFIDRIIHEAAHLFVFALSSQDELLFDQEKMVKSPLREDPRPMIGIYHAMFVLSRVIHFLEKLRKHPEFNIDPLSLERLINSNRNAFEDSISILQKHSSFTAGGKYLLESSIARSA